MEVNGDGKIRPTEPMADSATTAHAYLEVVLFDRPRQVVPISELPFFIGRDSEKGNHLILDDPHISRKCVAISAVPEGLRIEDRGQRGGIFVNGQQISDGRILCHGDRIRLGADGKCQLVFLSSKASHASDSGRATMPSHFRVSGLVDVAHNLPQQITAIGKEASCRFGLDTRPDLLEGSLSVSGSA